MNTRKLNFNLDTSGLPEDTEFSFIVYYFDHQIVAEQPFSKNTKFECDIYKPGLYSIEIIYKNSTGVSRFHTPNKYIEPEKIFNLNTDHDHIAFEKIIQKDHEGMEIEVFKASINNQIFNFIYAPSSEQKIYILCPSAKHKSTPSIHYFLRWRWAIKKIFPGNALVLSDPTWELDSSVRAGWFMGTKDNDATLNFCEIIKIFCKQLQIPFKNLIFWGSSTGGFIALQLCKYFPGSTAVSINGQTDIYKYHEHHELFTYCFNGMDEKDINEQYRKRLSIIEHSETLRKNNIFLVQNILDKHHYTKHFKPFMHKIAPYFQSEFPLGMWKIDTYPVTCWMYSHPDGHIAETEEMAKMIIDILEVGSERLKSIPKLQ